MISVDIQVRAHNLPAEIERDIEKLEKELAFRIVDEARTMIDSSTPSGRLYRRGGFRSRQSVGGMRARGAGARIHRASAPGQAPAEDTGKTYRDIHVRRMASGVYRVRFGGAAGYLEFGTRAPATRSIYHEGAKLSTIGPHRGGMRARPYIVPAIQKAIEKTFNGTKL